MLKHRWNAKQDRPLEHTGVYFHINLFKFEYITILDWIGYNSEFAVLNISLGTGLCLFSTPRFNTMSHLVTQDLADLKEIVDAGVDRASIGQGFAGGFLTAPPPGGGPATLQLENQPAAPSLEPPPPAPFGVRDSVDGRTA